MVTMMAECDDSVDIENKIENAKQSLTNILLSKREQTLINGASSWDVMIFIQKN